MDDHTAKVRRVQKAVLPTSHAEPRFSDDRPRQDTDVITDQRCADRAVGPDAAVSTDRHTRADRTARSELRASPHPGARADDNAVMDPHALLEHGGWVHSGAARIVAAQPVQAIRRPGVGGLRSVGHQRHAIGRHPVRPIGRDETGRGPRPGQVGLIAALSEIADRLVVGPPQRRHGVDQP